MPLVLNESELLAVDAVLLTHTHRDHFDPAAIEIVPKNMLLFCQPADEQKLRDLGFARANAINGQHDWNGLVISRTGGQHGTGAIGEKMGIVSGYVLRQAGEPSIYITGDTVWCPEVEQALVEHKPDIVVVFAGAAQFLTGDPITMTAQDVVKVCRHAPEAKVVVVHMENFNHCLLTRPLLKEELAKENLAKQVLIPADGEELTFVNAL